MITEFKVQQCMHMHNTTLSQHAEELAPPTNGVSEKQLVSMAIKQSFDRVGLTSFIILLEPWRAGESVASLSSETSPPAWVYKESQSFSWLFLDDKALTRKFKLA